MPSDRTRPRRFSARTIGLAGIFAVAMGVTLAAAGNTNAFGAARGTGFAPCLPGSQPISAHFTLTRPSEAGQISLDSIALAGFDTSSCDGSTVVVALKGNTAGDPTAPATEKLGTYDSALDPCTQAPAAHPVVITNGAITVTGCTAGGAAQYANLHDVTAIDISVNGSTLPTTVLGATFTKPGSTGASVTAKTTAVLGSSAQLPFTGSWAALTFWIGVLILAAGLFFLLVARRVSKSRQSAGPSPIGPQT